MTLCTDDRQSTGLFDLRRQLDIRTTTSHVGGDGHGTLTIGALTSQCHDVGLLLVQLGIQHLMGDTLTSARLRVHIHIEHTAQQLRDLHRGGTDQCRTTRVTHLHDLLDHSLIFLTGRLIHTVILVITDHRTVGWNLHHIQFVDIPELTSLRRGSTGHTSQLMVHTEVVL